MRKISTIAAVITGCFISLITCYGAGQEPGKPVADSLSFNTNAAGIPYIQTTTKWNSGGSDEISPYQSTADESGTPFSEAQAHVLNSNIELNLVAYYPFNGNANDESGNGNHGTVSGPVLYSDRFGKANSAYRYTAKNNVIDISNIAGATISVSLWYFFEGTGGSDWNTLLCQDGGTYHHLLINPTSKEIGFYNNGWYSSGIVLQTNTWYHIVLIKQNSTSIIYLNTQRIQYSGSSFSNSSYPLSRIGNYGGLSQGSLGVLDDIRVYNRVLTEEEITILYNEKRVRQSVPANNSVNVSSNPVFRWYKPGVGYSYHIQIAADQNFTSILKNVNGIGDSVYALQTSELQLNNSYYWRVRGYLGNDTTQWSYTWKFNTSGMIYYLPLSDTAAIGSRYLTNVWIYSPNGVNTGTFKPRVYYKKHTNSNTFNDNTNLTDGWKYTETTGHLGSYYTFYLDYSKLYGGEITSSAAIQYFVVAQDTLPLPNVAVYRGSLSSAPASVQLTSANFPVTGYITTYSICFLQNVNIWNYISIAESGLGRAVRFNVDNGNVVGVYQTSPTSGGDPSRTTVDFDGSVWVGNRALGAVCRIGLLLGGIRCNSDFTPSSTGEYLKPPFDYPLNALNKYDKDGDGLIKTSMGMLSGQQHFLPWVNNLPTDELIMYVSGLNNYCPNLTRVRHVSVDSSNNIWIGAHVSGSLGFLKINGQTGQVMETNCNGCGGYGGLVDRNQVLWSSSREPWGLLRYNTVTHAEQCLSAYGSYGLSIDTRGNIWNANWEQGRVRKFRPSGILVGDYNISRNARGVAVTPVDNNVWVVNSNNASVTRLDSLGNIIKYVGVGAGPTGVAVDYNGKVWVTNYDGNSLSRIDPNVSNGTVDLTVSLPSGSLPYNYSDMTGTTLRSVYPERFRSTPVVYGPTTVTSGQTANYTTVQKPGTSLVWKVTSGAINGTNSNDTVSVTWGDCGTGSVKLIQTLIALGVKDSTTVGITILVPSPVHHTPLNGATQVSLTPTLGWSPVSQATSYRVQLSTNPQFSTLLYDTLGITDTTWTSPMLNFLQTCYWRVKSIKVGCNSNWTSGWSFITIEPPPNLPPTINPIPDPAPIAEDASQQTVYFSGVTDGNPHPLQVQNISITAISSNSQIIPNPVVNYIPNATTGSLSYLPLPNANGTVTITLTLTDDGGTANGGQNTTTTSFNVVVLPVNDPPVANAGPDQTVNSGQLVTLNGSGSYDIDAGDVLTYHWSAPAGIVLSDVTAVNPTFTTPTVCVTTTYTISLVVNDGHVNSLSDMVAITVLPSPPDIFVVPASFTVTMPSGSSSTESLKIKNSGNCLLSVNLSAVSAWLSVTPSSGTIQPGDSANFIVYINASSLFAGTYESEITISSNDPDEPVTHIPVTLIVTGSPNISLTPLSLNFGVVYIGQTSNLILKISNNGTGNLNVTGITSNKPEFTLNVSTFIVSPGAFQNVIVTFAPVTADPIIGELTISNNDPNQPTILVPISGQGLPAPIISVTPASFTVTIPKNQISVQQLVIHNTGWSNLVYNLSENASWLSEWPVSGSISPGSMVVIDLTFSSVNLNPGNYGTTLKINCNDPVFPLISIPVSFNVLEPLWVEATATPPEICSGSSATLHAVPHGGYGNYTFSWTSDPPGFSSTQQNPVVSPVVTTTYYVNVSDGHDNASASSTVTLYNNQPPSQVSNMIPPNHSYGLTLPITFSWAPAANAAVYDLYIWHYDQPPPSTPTVPGITQITYIWPGGGSFSYGDTCKWMIVARNPCFQTSGPVYLFSIKGLPDLHITAINTSTPVAGQPVTITWTVKNDGDAETPPGTIWLDRVWISPDIEVRIGESEDILLGQFQNVSYLAPGESYVQTRQITMPENLMGTYFLFVIADDLDALFINWPPSGPPLPYNPPPYYTSYSHGGSTVQEYVEHDNFFYKEITFAIPPLPDLQVTSIISPGNVFSGQTANITWTVKNKGDGNTNTGNWSDRIYLSADTTLNPATAINLGTFARNGILNPDSSYSQTRTISIPSNIYGTYYFYVTTDINNNVFEHVYENNNTRQSDSVSVYLTPPPDLVVTDVIAPDTISNFDIFNIVWSVQNQGASSPSVSSWYDGIYLSDSPTYDLSDAIYLGPAPRYGTLAPDSSYSMQKAVSLRKNISGDYYLYVYTDINNVVFEYNNENNNILRSDEPVYIINPDLVVTNVIIPPENNNGQPFSIQWTVKNNGPGKILQQSWKDKLYISRYSVYHPDSVVAIGEASVNDVTLNKGEAINQNKIVTLPDNISGECYIYIHTDWNNSVYENNHENNNICRSAGYMSVLKPDLAVSDVVVPVVDSTAKPVSISWKVTNLGPGTILNRNWTDRILISFSPVYNPATVIPIGTVNCNGSLEPGMSLQKTMSVTLPDSIPGPYYIFVHTDCFDVIYEDLAEQNNIARSSSTIQILLPDLVVRNLTLPMNILSGEEMTVYWTTKNIGQTWINNKTWTDRILISSSPICNPSEDEILGDLVHNSTLPSGDSINNDKKVLLPDGIQGTYYVHVYTDYKQEIPENIHENNNIATKSLLVSPGPWADLTVMNILIPDSSMAGSALPVDFIVKNIGTKTIVNKSWTDKVYISTLPAWNPSSTMFLREFIQSISLAPNISYSINSTVNIPSGLPTGNYYIYVFTDADSTIFENTGENNNVFRSSQVHISALPPVDLIVLGVTNPDSANSGEPVNVQWTVKNSGLSPTVNSWYDALYLSTDSIWNPNTDLYLGNRLHYGQLYPGGSYTCSQLFNLPNGVQGDFYLLAVADYNQTNNDLNLLNNYRSKTNTENEMQKIHITLTPPPDLIVTTMSTPSQVLTGVPFTISWTVKNDGIGSAVTSGWTDKIFLSTDLTINAGDLLIGSKSHSGPLAVSQTYNENLQVTLPSSISGNYIILIKTDFENTVYESNENNNTKYTFILVSQPPPADLIVSDISPPGTVVVGETATIYWNIKNIGQHPASGMVKDMIFLSADTIWDINDVLFGTYQSGISLGAGAEITRELTEKVIDLVVGEYWVIVRTDVLNTIYENNELNNASVSAYPVYSDVNLLPIGEEKQNVLVDFEPLYYRIPVSDSLNDETMLTTLRADSLFGRNDMFLRHNLMPTRIKYDYTSGNPFVGNQEILVPSIDEGNYYMMLYGSTTNGNSQDITVKAEILEFKILSVFPNTAGNTGKVTVLIRGSNFNPDMSYKLLGAEPITATSTVFVNRSRVYATFDLSDAVPGLYDVIADNYCADRDTLFQAFEITEGISPVLGLFVITPPNVRANRVTSFTVEYMNTGNIDLYDPKILIKSEGGAPIALTVDELSQHMQEMTLSLTEPGGPPGILRPGYLGSRIIYTKSTGPLGFTIMILK
jgi:subtilase family serine protease/streptogramin lyase